tara:strand:- start:346 stop:633 length:288 start_codon:yes stop_codon:yes gene_type:complete
MYSLKLTKTEITTLLTALVLANERYQNMASTVENVIKINNMDERKANAFRDFVKELTRDVNNILEKIRADFGDEHGVYDMQTLMRVAGFNKEPIN